MTDISTEADQKAHYAAIRQRLNNLPKPRHALRIAPAPIEPISPPEPMPEPTPAIDLLDEPPSVINARWKTIVIEVCLKHGIGINDIRSHHRATNIVAARREAMYRMRHETLLSLPEIGRRMGGFDHTTVIHSIGKHRETLAGVAPPRDPRYIGQEEARP